MCVSLEAGTVLQKKINSLIIILGYIDVSILKLFEMLKQNIKICWNYFTYSFF